MAIEYDLVIFGASPEGLAAAARAVQLGGRVALITQGLDGRRSPVYLQGMLDGLQTFSRPSTATLRFHWQSLQRRSGMIADTLTSEDLEKLMVQGCDVIAEWGHVVSDRPLTLHTATRTLTTRALLLASGQRPAVPAVAGLAMPLYETPTSCLQRDTPPADPVVIMGGSPSGLALAQGLTRLGLAVTLVTPQDHLLSQEDQSVRQWIAAQLRAEGITLRLETAVAEVLDTGTLTLKLTDETTFTAQTLVVAAAGCPNLGEMGLEAWFPRDRPLTVNPYLQTCQPRIFACGSLLGGYDAPAIALQEARLAVENALFWQRQRIDYAILPYDVPTQPRFARVGLTEAQARERYDADDILVHRQPLCDQPQAQWRASVTGFCKLIAHRDGPLLGIHGVGVDAHEWIQATTWLMNQSTPWWRLAQYPALPGSAIAIVQQASTVWERDRWQPGRWRHDWGNNWCNWRRNR